MHFSSQAIAGFAGVVTGSLLTGGFQWLVAARADRKLIRRSRRLIRVELRELKNAVIGSMMHELRAEEILLEETPLWEENRDELAEHLARESRWEKVETAYSTYRRHRAATLQRRETPGRPPRDVWARLGNETIGLIDEALRALGENVPRIVGDVYVNPPAYSGSNERPDRPAGG